MSQLIYNDLKKLVREVVGADTPTDIIVGTVDSLSPLKVMVDNNSEYFPSSCFVVPEHLTDREIEVEYEGENIAQNNEPLHFKGKMKINEGLKVGDVVLMLQCLKGQKLIILDRLAK